MPSEMLSVMAVSVVRLNNCYSDKNFKIPLNLKWGNLGLFQLFLSITINAELWMSLGLWWMLTSGDNRPMAPVSPSWLAPTLSQALRAEWMVVTSRTARLAPSHSLHPPDNYVLFKDIVNCQPFNCFWDFTRKKWTENEAKHLIFHS